MMTVVVVMVMVMVMMVLDCVSGNYGCCWFNLVHFQFREKGDHINCLNKLIE